MTCPHCGQEDCTAEGPQSTKWNQSSQPADRAEIRADVERWRNDCPELQRLAGHIDTLLRDNAEWRNEAADRLREWERQQQTIDELLSESARLRKALEEITRYEDFKHMVWRDSVIAALAPQEADA